MKRFVSCDSLWDLLSAYADGEAKPAEAALVEQHVADCRECARELAFLREASRLLAGTPAVPPPPGLQRAILQATLYRPTWQSRLQQALSGWRPARRLSLLGTAAAATLLLVIALHRPERPVPASQPVVTERPAERVALNTGLPTLSTTHPPVRRTTAEPSRPAPRPHRPRRDTIAAGLATHMPPVASRPAPAQPAPERRTASKSRPSVHPVPRIRPEMTTPTITPPEMPPVTPDTTRPLDRTEIARGNTASPGIDKTETSEAVASAPGNGRITLVASVPTNAAAATLAGLRNDLRSAPRPAALYHFSDHREVTLDVFRTRF